MFWLLYIIRDFTSVPGHPQSRKKNDSVADLYRPVSNQFFYPI
jgi:hypothetical protein